MPDLFTEAKPTIEDQWRGIVLFGQNVASYKFALAKALLDLKPVDGQLVKLGELAVPFSTFIAEHLKHADKQITSQTSRFLDACRKFNAGEISPDQLRDETVRMGFINVIDAFHVVGQSPTPERFFVDERATNKGIRITSRFSELMAGIQAPSLMIEVESRWRLVETAWELGVSRNLVRIDYDESTKGLFALDSARRRTAVTSSRGALNGYQKGKCFYCFRDISIAAKDLLPDVDHFFPHVLKAYEFGPLVDGIWNLVLACKDCNRGVGGKSASVPSIRLLERLWRRNEYLIKSHHPLRETILQQTGILEPERRAFMNDWHRRAWSVLIHQWDPPQVADEVF